MGEKHVKGENVYSRGEFVDMMYIEKKLYSIPYKINFEKSQK